jgi:hypothetical protein
MTKKDILAVKNGRQQWFTRRSWDLLGNNKLGWEEVRPEPPTPKEVVMPVRETIEVQDEQPEIQTPKRGRKKK